MRDRSLARRYAQALFMSSRQKNMLDQVEKELGLVVDTIDQSEELQQLIERQLIPPWDKIAIFERLFKGRVSDMTMSFLKLVFKKRRERYLKDMLGEFRDFADSARGVVEVEVKTAMEMTPEQEGQIRKRLAAITGKDVRLEKKVDRGLIGGIVIKIGDRVYDGSAVNQLQALKKHLESAHLELEGDRGEIAT